MSNSAILTFVSQGRPPVHVFHQWLDERLMRKAFRACVRDHVRFDYVPEAYISHRYAYESRFRRQRIREHATWSSITCPHVIDDPDHWITDNGTAIVNSWSYTGDLLIEITWSDGQTERFPKKRKVATSG